MRTGSPPRRWLVAAAALGACAPAPAPVPVAPPTVEVTRAVTPAAPPLPSAQPEAPPPPPPAPPPPPEPDPPPQPGPPAQPAPTVGMVLLPGGTYTTKSYRKAATLVPFWLDVTEVTAGAYRACVVAGKCNEEGLLCDEIHTYGVRGKESHPINCVSQRQAMDHCAYLGKRLPTPEEWEWAARGTTRGSTYPWGEQEPSRQLCWKRYDYQEHLVSRRFCPEDTPKECFNTSVWEGRKRVDGPCRVRSFPAGSTPQGIADLAGNVSEWTAGGSPKGRPLRGCDWKENDPRGAEASADGQARLDAHLDSVGFRCAWTAMAAP